MIVAYAFWGPQLDKLLRGNVLLSQITPIVQLEQEYLLKLENSLSPLSPEEVASAEALQQRFIETLFIHVKEFDVKDSNSATKFLVEYYGFTEPIPAGVQENMKAAVEKFIISYPLFADGENSSDTTSTTSTETTNNTTSASAEKDFQPFLDQIITILANHQVSTNNHQSVKRAQTIQSLMEAFANEL